MLRRDGGERDGGVCDSGLAMGAEPAPVARLRPAGPRVAGLRPKGLRPGGLGTAGLRPIAARALWAIAAIAAVVHATPSVAQAQDPEVEATSVPAALGAWSGDSAWTIAADRVEFGLFQPLRWGVTDSLELSAHPLLQLALPHVEAKIAWHQHGEFAFASRHRLSYPTLFLETVSREGAGGLLPADTDVPTMAGLDTAWLMSWSANQYALFTFELGLSLAPHLSDGDAVLLDFPFLYSRFAATAGGASVFAAMVVNGALFDGLLAWQFDARFTTVPAVPRGFAVEPGFSLSWRPSDGFSMLLGMRVARGRYPVGLRTHVLPTFDVIFGL